VSEDPELFGTHFYQHRQMNKKRFISSTPAKDDIFKTFVLEDTFNEEAWEKWQTIAFKKNRLVVFDGHLFHSGPKKSFGQCPLDARVTQLFFPLQPK
jgi:hypothetical protein